MANISYKIIKIYTNEDAQFNGHPLYQKIINFIVSKGLYSRCTVTKCISGCYESGEIATSKIFLPSSNIPLIIDIIISSEEVDDVLEEITKIVTDGIVILEDLNVISHLSKKRFLADKLKVKDVMTHNPETVNPATPLTRILQILVNSSFKCLPVLDEKKNIKGIITQDDLVSKGQIPLRVDLLGEPENGYIGQIQPSLMTKYAQDIMSSPVISINANEYLSEAITIMVKNHIKRLPVIDDKGTLIGMLSRLDVFRAIGSKEEFELQDNKPVLSNHINKVGDIIRRDVNTVRPEASIWEVLKLIYKNVIQRVAVVDEYGYLLGIITVRDIFDQFSEKPYDIRDVLISKFLHSEKGRKQRPLIDRLKAKSAGELMIKNFISAKEETPIEVAAYIMEQRSLKRLPVIDSSGKFKGMISRDDILRIIARK